MNKISMHNHIGRSRNVYLHPKEMRTIFRNSKLHAVITELCLNYELKLLTEKKFRLKLGSDTTIPCRIKTAVSVDRATFDVHLYIYVHLTHAPIFIVCGPLILHAVSMLDV